jgi:succinate dehydrogenase/fumarate reductase flavoprotein subunit
MSGVKVMTEYASRLGAKFRMKTGLVKLLKKEGRVTGAIAKDLKTGRYLRINASRGVIVATGVTPETWKCFKPSSLKLLR